MSTNVINTVERKIVPLQKLAAIIAVFSAIGGIYWFYMENTMPDVKVIKADYDKGMADITIAGKPVKLYRTSVLHARADWGVQMSEAPNRIELTKNGMVKKIIAQA